jgi:hypothetical protein
MVTLILAVIPLLIFVVGLIETGMKGFEKHWLEMSMFAVVTVVAWAFGYFAHWRKKETRKLLEERGFHLKEPKEIVKTLGQLIVGAILLLGVVGAGIYGGWQLIDGSLLLGGIAAGAGLVVGSLFHKPRAKRNFLKRWYSALVGGSPDSADEQTETPASSPVSDRE